MYTAVVFDGDKSVTMRGITPEQAMQRAADALFASKERLRISTSRVTWRPADGVIFRDQTPFGVLFVGASSKTMKAPFGWTVIRRDSAPDGFYVYKRDCPADAKHYAEDLAKFTFETKAIAYAQGKLGNYAYKPKESKYWVYWTYLGNYCDLQEVTASSPKEATEKVVGFYEGNEDWKKHSHVYVLLQPPCFELKPGRE